MLKGSMENRLDNAPREILRNTQNTTGERQDVIYDGSAHLIPESFVSTPPHDSSWSLLKKLLSKALPLSLAGMFTVSSNFIIVALLSRVSKDDLAAYVTVSSASGICINPLIALTSQLPVFVSEIYALIKSGNTSGQNVHRRHEIENNVKSAWYFGFAVSIIPIAILANMQFISKLFIADDSIRKKVGSYFLPYVFSIPLQMFNSVNLSLLSAIDEEKHIYWLSFLQITTEVGLAFWLIPLYGISGSGYIKLVSSLLLAVGFIAISFLSKHIKEYSLLKFNWRSGIQYTKKYIKPLLNQGMPTSIYTFSLFGSNFISAVFVNKLGKTELVIFQSILEYLNPFYVACRGISEAGNRYVAQTLGTQNYCSLKKYAYLSLVFAPGFLAVAYAIGIAVAPQFVSLFVSDSKETENESFIRLTFMFFAISKTLNLLEDTCGRLLSGMEDTYLLAIVNILTTFVLILPLQAMNEKLLNWNIYGIAISTGVGYLVSATLLIKYFSKQIENAISNNTYEAESDSSNAWISQYIRTTIFQKCNLNRRSSPDGQRYYEGIRDQTSLQQVEEFSEALIV